MTPTNALITGAGSGMGQLAAWKLAAAGVHVAALDVNDEGLEQTAARDPHVRAYRCDVTDRAEVDTVVSLVESDLGPLDRVMNAAGIARVGLLLDQDVGEMMRMMEINYGGTATMTTATLPGMLERGRGELVNFASMAGWIPQKKMGAYCATKFAVVAYSEALWQENRGKGVKIACVCPPAVRTPMLPDFFVRPESQQKAMPITAEAVVDAIEKALDRDRFLVLPHASAKVLWRLRRHTPSVLRRVISSERFDLI